MFISLILKAKSDLIEIRLYFSDGIHDRQLSKYPDLKTDSLCFSKAIQIWVTLQIMATRVLITVMVRIPDIQNPDSSEY